MSYRSIKRYLGETNLERKIRILFGACLAVLILAAFLYVNWIITSDVSQITRSQGRHLTEMAILKFHFKLTGSSNLENPEGTQALDEMFRNDMQTDNYRTEVLALVPAGASTSADGGEKVEEEIVSILTLITARKPNNDERVLLQFMQDTLLKQEQSSLVTDNSSSPGSARGPKPTGREAAHSVFAEQSVKVNIGGKRGTEYHYYAPIHWGSSCQTCHHTNATPGDLLADNQIPLHAVKVAIPFTQTKDALTKMFVILLSTGIVTVFVAMIGLYVIVRYVIVKPLKHLRDVSDEISRGNNDLRADLNTGDEFQELADSFNRMLHHMIDTQGELREVNKSLDGKVDQLAQLNMRLHEMNLLKSDFLANMSHELRTPLNSIIGFSEVLQSIKSLDVKQKRYAENIQKSGRILLEMINDILDLAKIEAGRMELRLSEIDIASVIQAHCDMVRALSEEKNIDVNVSVSSRLPPVYQDQTKLQQILTNLLSNAIKFTPEGGRIDVAARRTGDDQLELIVADTGVGIAKEDLDVIFEKFRQGLSAKGEDTLTREYAGTGLGLSIVRELCKLMGGDVSVKSELGKGSTFKVLLPWTCRVQPIHHTELETKLDAITKPKRVDFQSANDVAQSPLPATTAATTAVDQQAEV